MGNIISWNSREKIFNYKIVIMLKFIDWEECWYVALNNGETKYQNEVHEYMSMKCGVVLLSIY